jgi:4-hydroxy-tetrahydrodipicolinate synthase
MVTPFDSRGVFDGEGAVALAKWLCSHGNDFLVLSGTTGEAPALSDAEKVELWQRIASAVDAPVIAGTSTPDTAHSVELTASARKAGVAAILAVTPYYNRPSQAGIEAHLRSIGRAAGDTPVLLYDIPGRTGRKVDLQVIIRLAAEGVICGVKDATGNPAATAGLIAEAPPAFEVYSGNDADTLPLLAVGAVGTISVESHWAGELLGEMIACFAKGDVERARALNGRLLDSHAFQSSDEAPNPVPAKAMLRTMGLPAGQCRLPMGDAPAGLEDRARLVLEQLHG